MCQSGHVRHRYRGWAYSAFHREGYHVGIARIWRAWNMVMLRSITMFCANLKAAMSGRPQGPYTVKKRRPVTDIE